MILRTDKFEIERFESNLGVNMISFRSDYVICQSDVLDSAYEDKLLQMGFHFLDRILYFEINTDRFVKRFSRNTVSEIDLVCDTKLDDDVFQLACEVYTSDRRFHLDSVFDQSKANLVIEAYIDYFRRRSIRVYKALYREKLLGFTVVDEKADSTNVFFENMLGATRPGIKGKMVAGPLYSFMIAEEGKIFKKYVGRVSSSNIASINLHHQLGGNVKKIYDEFIYRNERR